MVSVIIPVYNVERYLARCLDSVLGQTVGDMEVICVDDGSSDSSAAIAAGYEKSDSRVKVIRQANAGQGAARNRGLDAIGGESFAFVDADDYLHPQYLETLLRAMEKSCAPIVASDRYTCTSKAAHAAAAADLRQWGAECGVFRFRDFVRDRRIFSSVWNKLYRRDAAGDVRFLSHPFEDWPYLVKVFAKAGTYAKISAPLYFYNDENVSTIRSPFGERKVKGYLTGIEDVARIFKGTSQESDVRRRCAVAAKMLMSKARKCEAPLRRMAAEGLCGIVREGLMAHGDLDLKTRIRFWRLRREFGL